MSKKILRILLTMTLCLFLFPVFVHAEENPAPITTLYVNGVDVLENPHTGDWRFDASTGTLTLYDIEITTGYEAEDSPGTYAGIYAEGDLNIVSGGEGTDIISLSQPEVKSAYGILVSGDLNITETQLCIRNNLIPNESYGIVALGNITISDAVIEYQCYFNSLSSVGIFGFSQLDIQNSKLIDIRAPYTESGFGLLSYGGITLNNNDEVYISGMHAGIFSAL